MNFVFISPNFPTNYYMFCRNLKNNGLNVLGIGDCPYDELNDEVKYSLTEYYKVNSLENFYEKEEACRFFENKYGKLDWLESNNEYWLLDDAKLRTIFNIQSGVNDKEVDCIKYKSKMKAFYEKAGVASARYHLVDDLEGCKAFIDKVGYPLVVKPDNGVGAFATYKLNNEKDLINFLNEKPDITYIMEEFVDGDLVSFDGIADAERNIVFKTTHCFPEQIMDIVNESKDVMYYSLREIPEDLNEVGERVVKTFPTNSRFFHCEYFRLKNDKEGLGKKGDIIGLEVNMRPPGGFTPDMMNYANDIDVYKIWADMIAYNHADYNKERPYFCVYVARRDGNSYKHNLNEVLERYQHFIVMNERMPDVLAVAMGNQMITARFKTKYEVDEFIRFALER